MTFAARHDPSRNPICGIILAAGSSARMGRPKQLLPITRHAALQGVVDEAARAGLAELIVVLGHRADEVRRAVQLPPRARFVVNSDYARGMSTSLAAGLRAASADAVRLPCCSATNQASPRPTSTASSPPLAQTRSRSRAPCT